MSLSLEQKDRLPLALATSRLLTVVDALPATTPERRRVLTALGLVESEAWLRVELRTDGDPRDILERAEQWATPHDLAHVLELADTIAHAYDHAAVTNAHIALALVASARRDGQERGRMLSIVAEAFDLGTLEDIETIAGVHLRRVESSGADPDVSDLQMTLSEPWWTITRIAPWVHPLLRLALVVILIVLAVSAGNVAAWIIAVGAAVPFRDPRLKDWPSGPRYPRGIPVNLPSLLVLSGVAAVFGLAAMAVVLFAAHVVFEGLGIVFDRIRYRYLQVDGTALQDLRPHRALIGNALGQVYRGSYRNRLLKWALPLAPVVIFATRWDDTFTARVLSGVAARLGVGTVDQLPPAIAALAMTRSAAIGVLFAVMLLLSASGRFVLAAVFAVATVVVFGWPPVVAVVVVLGALIFVLDWWMWRRIPSARFPIPLFLPRHRALSGVVAQIAVRRTLRLARPVGALAVWEHWMSTLPAEARSTPSRTRMIHAHLLLEAGRPGEAWDLRDSFPPTAEIFRAYVVARTLFLLNRPQEAYDVATDLTARMAATPLRIPRSLRVVSALTMTEIAAAVVPEDLVGLTILNSIPAMATGGRVVEPVRMFRYAAAAFAPTRPILAERCALAASGLAILASEERATAREKNRESTLTAEGSLAACGTMRYLFGNGDISVATLENWRTNAEVVFRLASPVEVAYELRAMAEKLEAVRGFEVMAYRLRLDIVGVLNTVRHELRVREDRLAWWQTFHEALSRAIEGAFEGKDWATLAELIEYGRLQSQAQVAPGLGSRKPLFVRVAGRSVLQDGFWERPGAPAPAYDLEAAAAVAGGPLSWWWSTWRTGAHMYWSLVVPGEAPKGGRVPMAELRGPLARLRDAVPIVLPGESPAQRQHRMASSPLLRAIGRERDLARDLALLLPEALRTALRNAPAQISLAIAPDVEFAHVPWAAIILDGDDERLLERARLTIAPPVAALAEIVDRADGDGASDRPRPVRLAVLDPGGDLPAAASLTDALPDDVVLRAPASGLTVDMVGAALEDTPPDSTWLFAGHTTAIPPDGRAGLSLRARGAYEPSRAIPGDALPPLPRASILLACESGDLSNATAGEWSTLGPALLAAGSDRAVVTAFPIRDASEIDRAIIRRVGELPLGEALHRAQLEQLAQWRDTRGRLSPPADWAGHALIGVVDAALPLPARYGPSRVWVSTSALQLMDAAAVAAARRGASQVEVSDLWAAVLDWGWESLGRHIDVALRVLNRVTHPHRRSDVAAVGIGLSDGVRQRVDEAVRISRALHHRIVSEDHILAACFAGSEPTARVARRLTGLDPRTIDGAAFMTERDAPGWEHTGIPQLKALSRPAAVEVCTLAGAVAEPEERWYHTDR